MKLKNVLIKDRVFCMLKVSTVMSLAYITIRKPKLIKNKSVKQFYVNKVLENGKRNSSNQG